MSALDLGVCPVCGIVAYLTTQGALRSHGEPRCQGTGKAPAEVIRR